MAKKQVSTLLHSHHPLALLFPLKKEHVHLYAHQRGSKTPGKQHSPLVLPFSLKKECVHLYTRSTPGEICAYMGTEKERQNGRKSGYLRPSAAIILWFFSFPRNKKCAYLSAHQTGSKTPVHLYTHLTWRRICADMGNEKEMKKWRKRRELHHFGATYFPLAFLFPLQKNVCIYTHIKRGDTCVHTWRMEKEGKKKGKEKGERGKGMKKR